MSVKLGCEVFLDEWVSRAEGLKLGFLTNHTGLTSKLKPLVTCFLEHGLHLQALFGPEHGIRGAVADGEHVASGRDAKTGLPVYSLYGDTRKPTPEMLKGLDALVFDIQDVGSRFYTFMWTMAHALEAVVEVGLRMIILDRPNPITGAAVEGPVLDPAYASLVGLYPVSTRHGMTVGEVARFVAGRISAPKDSLEVVQMRGWRREMWFDECGLQWVMPSPGMPTLETATVYPGMCVFEGTNVSEGRGTTRPFEIIGAPWIDADALADAINAEQIAGAVARAVYFQPWFSKHKDTPCAGIQLHVLNRDAFRPVAAGLQVLCTVRKMYPDEFAFREPGPSGKYFIDLLTGGDQVRRRVESGVPALEIAQGWEQNLQDFIRARKQYLLY